VCALKAHTRKKINDIEELRPTGSAMLSDGVIYCAFYGFFVFVRAEKTKKRGSEGARARAAGELARIGGGMAAGCWREGWRCGGGMLAAWLEVVPVVLVVVVGAFLIKVYYYTAFIVVCCGY